MAPRIEHAYFSTSERDARERRRRDYLRDRPPPSPEQMDLGRAAIEHLKEHVPGLGLSGALASMSDIGIDVRPNVYQSADNGAWILNGIRFSRDGVKVTTGELRINNLFHPDRNFAFVPARDGPLMRQLLVDFHLARGQGAGGLPLSEDGGSRSKPRHPENQVDWHETSVLPEQVEVYGLLVSGDTERPPQIMAGTMVDGSFSGINDTPVPKGWKIDGWLDLAEACVPGASDGQLVPASGVILRGQGISDGLRDLVAKTNEHAHSLEQFNYRMSMGRDAWSHMKTADMWPLANAVCDPDERQRIEDLPPSRRRGAIRSICRGFDPVHAISYEERRDTLGREGRDQMIDIRHSLDI
jgi:hypothetical protein